MNTLLEAALGLQDLLDSWNWRFCVIGGIAVLRWGEARFTRDVDLTLLTGYGHEDYFILPLPGAGYQCRLSDTAEFARRGRVLLVTAPNGVSVDIALAALPFEAQAIRTCSAVAANIRARVTPRPGKARNRPRTVPPSNPAPRRHPAAELCILLQSPGTGYEIVKLSACQRTPEKQKGFRGEYAA
jgi:hypothetical protein